jgi:hypothetical protein
MNKHGARWMTAIGLVGLLGSHGVLAEQQSSTPATPMDGMQPGGMQHGGMGGMAGQQQGMAGMQHGSTGASEGQQAGGMQGMQHGGAGGGMMGGMGGGMMGGMMGSMSEKEQEEAWKKLEAQDIRLGELRRQIREANEQALRDKLKSEHQTVLKDQVALMHKLMTQEHMKSMKGGMSMGGSAAPASAHPANP